VVKKLFNFRFDASFEKDLQAAKKKLHTKTKTSTIEKAIKELIQFK